MEEFLGAIERISVYTRDKELADFVASTATLGAVLDNPVVMGEAASPIRHSAAR